MSFSFPRPRSVRARITVAAVLVAVLGFGAAGVALYTIASSYLDRDLRYRNDLAAERTAERVAENRPTGVLPRSEQGADIIAILSEGGAVLAANTVMGEVSPLAGFRPPPGAEDADRVMSTPQIAEGRPVYVTVVRTDPRGGERFYVYAVSELDHVAQNLSVVLFILLCAAPVFVGGVAVLSWWTATMALRPVEAIRTEMAGITARDLNRRVPEPGTRDEIARLARTANETLDRLDRSVARQRQFVADASHELRTPIAGLQARLEVALRGPKGADLRTDVQLALTDTERLGRIATDLLLLARLDSDPPPREEPVDLTLLVAEEVARHAYPRVPVHVDLAEGVMVMGDAGQLSRVLTNLISNAQRYATTKVDVVLTTGAGEARVEVVDDGPGVPPEQRQWVFERFARLPGDREREGGGAGLGLAIARDIAIRHRGLLTLEDGSRFVLTLPSHP